MIKKRNLSQGGLNANVSLEPASAASSNNNINNNIYIKTPYPTDSPVKLPSEFDTRDSSNGNIALRDIELDEAVQTDPFKESEAVLQNKSAVKEFILQTFANILLTQDKALLANVISKETIIIPFDSLQTIIQKMTNADVEIKFDDDCACCASKVNPVKKIDFIKIVRNDGEVITDFKQVFNKEYNELTRQYHINLKYVLV